ncbi:hypothetical protein JN11_03825 [Mucilaginibacter frigoritolerans]|jgi:hypothetical protein|uniref:Uncharacterized protein n=1 Tax=Mucilaginibacter frigoritolerans TaxID=652788 RepID=A0A562TTE6_9SPHI|nr:hypothetical protein [Mucilaginibacter frigoritolerans]TWI96713.1 hypothetical protein JN11_03825 [Mucilaginibacter frigoritolerans]
MDNKEIDEKKQSYNMWVVGVNLAVLAVYTVISKANTELGPLLDAFLIAIHVAVCILWAAIASKRIWWLTALVVLLIGFSTCVGILWR